jgi:hypothetical protein
MKIFFLITACLVSASACCTVPSADHAGGDAAINADGRHDFDFEIGSWKTHVKRLLKPLSHSSDWTEYDGTTIVRPVWDGKANLLELSMDGVRGHFQGLSLRVFNPSARQWILSFVNAGSGALGTPAMGEFKDGRGEFYDQEMFEGRAIFVRFVISDIRKDSVHFEQSFSADGGKTWESNWVADDVRQTESSDRH